MAKTIIRNRFDAKKTKIVFIHDGRFHADDMMFAALAKVAAEKNKNNVEIKRVGEIPKEYREDAIAGDIGLGIYDHHADFDGTASLGCSYNTETRTVSACGLLYYDVKNILFPGDSETKRLFEALIDQIEHCDNTSDNNTFSDSIGFLTPADESKMDDAADIALMYCRAVILGFVESHKKEKSGKIWAIPKVCNGVVPGVADKRDIRYWKASTQIKNKYKYISFNGEKEIKLKAMDTYSLVCGALGHNKRLYWREIIETQDAEQLLEMEKREKEDWPRAVQSMQHRTIYLERYLPYGQYVKDVNALFVVLPSQRRGYNVSILKTNTGKFRFEPSLLLNFPGCFFTANDNRFVAFETKEQAIEAAHQCGKTVSRYLEKYGVNGYRNIYGGCLKEYTGDLYQDIISENVALNMFVKENIKNVNSLSVDEFHMLQIIAAANPYLKHIFCVRFKNDGENMRWNLEATSVFEGLTEETLWTKNTNGMKWNMGLDSFLMTERGAFLVNKLFPKNS